MKLSTLIENIDVDIKDQSLLDVEVQSICCDSRQVVSGSLFIAMKGVSVDGHDFIEKAIENKAVAVICSKDYVYLGGETEHFIRVNDPAYVLRQVALAYFNNPSKDVGVIGVTGTNGKTSIAYMIESILHVAEKSCGVVGTINYRIGERILPATNTTPGLIDNQKLLSMLVEDGIDYCVMEVSSHALDQGRVDLIHFKTAIFSNLTSDHLDYHVSQQDYFEAKAKLFKHLGEECLAVINADDDFGRKLYSKCSSKISTYGIHNKAEIMATDIEVAMDYTKFKIQSGDEEIFVRTQLVGQYNIYNILAATAACIGEGINLHTIKEGIESLNLVPGRLERVQCQQDYSIFIDYAHTEDALKNVLKALRAVTSAKIILVFGCGGDRDISKRPAMGKVASDMADYSIVTSDNPRSEDPQFIIDQIVQGFEANNFEVEVDRERAIIKSLNIANTGDIVLIAGKGHEDYQTFKDGSIKFDERTIIRQYLRC